jgi:hypothetical protein
MTIVRKSAPRDGPAVVGGALVHLMAPAAQSRGFEMRRGGAVATNLSQPVQLFILALRDIKSENFLDKARPFGWRYLVVNAGPVAMADLKSGSSANKPSSFAALIQGPLTQSFSRACALVQRRFGATAQKYEVRLLEVPALSVSALWVHSKVGQDIFIPLDVDGKGPRVAANFKKSVLTAASARVAPNKASPHASGQRTRSAKIRRPARSKRR